MILAGVLGLLTVLVTKIDYTLFCAVALSFAHRLHILSLYSEVSSVDGNMTAMLNILLSFDIISDCTRVTIFDNGFIGILLSIRSSAYFLSSCLQEHARGTCLDAKLFRVCCRNFQKRL